MESQPHGSKPESTQPESAQPPSAQPGESDSLLWQAVDRTERPSEPDSTPLAAGVVIGTVVAIGESGCHVDFPQNPDAEPQAALLAATVAADDVGRRVALAFPAQDWRQPLVLGLIHESVAAETTGALETEGDESLEVVADDRRVTISAEKELVLRCGKSSITLTPGGKIIVRGTHLLQRASGVNRIKGGSVQIN